MPTTEAGIGTHGFSQLYASLGEIQPDGSSAIIRLYWKPYVTLIWYGAIIMFFGGIMSLWDRYIVFAKRRQSRAKPSEMSDFADKVKA